MQIAQREPTQDDRLPVTAPTITSTETVRLASDTQTSRLAGQVHECSPAAEPQHPLAHWLHPLGALARISVANGVFARSLFHSGWRDFQVPVTEGPNVHFDHVIDQVNYVQKMRLESISAMAEMAKAWPVFASSVVWGQLVAGLLQRAKFHRIERDRDDREF